MHDPDRRNFIKGTIAGGLFLGFAGLITRLERFEASGITSLAGGSSPYGPIAPTAAANTGETLLSLPAGFQYNVISRAGSPMTNGQLTPILHDGMGAFRSSSLPNSWVLVRNHENANFAATAGAVNGTPPYDPMAAGGTTTLVVDKQTRLLSDSFVSLSGTVKNCAGGMTPWGSWITCEETTVGVSSGFANSHGYCFEVDPMTPSAPVPLTAMGRFVHEAAAVDRFEGIVYLTEDSNPAGFYRFLPNRPGVLAQGGKLQMLAINGQPNADLRTNRTVGETLNVEWVDIADPNPSAAETNISAVFSQGFTSGGASFARLEGCFADFRSVYFTSTNGGNQGLGQVWRCESRKKSRFGRLTLIFESPSAEVLDFPDNICFGPRGNMYICEDGSAGNFLRLLKPSGTIHDFAKNVVPSFEPYEFTGSVFSPDLQTLFVNIQTPGLTFAIWGPW